MTDLERENVVLKDQRNALANSLVDVLERLDELEHRIDDLEVRYGQFVINNEIEQRKLLRRVGGLEDELHIDAPDEP